MDNAPQLLNLTFQSCRRRVLSSGADGSRYQLDSTLRLGLVVFVCCPERLRDAHWPSATSCMLTCGSRTHTGGVWPTGLRQEPSVNIFPAVDVALIEEDLQEVRVRSSNMVVLGWRGCPNSHIFSSTVYLARSCSTSAGSVIVPRRLV